MYRTRRNALRSRALMALGVSALLIGAGCGDDTDSSDAGSTTVTSVDPGVTTSTERGASTIASTAPDGSVPESPLLAEAREDGITIGIANERPYGFEADGEATGEAPELGEEIFSRMGIDQVEFTVVDFNGLISGLNAGRFDVIAAGMFINPERAEQVLFADPDYCAATAFAVPEGNPDGLTDFQSVIDTGVTLGVLAGAVEEGYALDAGVPERQLSPYQRTPDLFDALAARRVDAVALTAITVREQVADLPGFEATPGFIPVIQGEEQLGCGAFAFRYENEPFRDAFNDVLDEMQANGEVLPIIEPFGFTATEVETAKDLTAADLAG